MFFYHFPNLASISGFINLLTENQMAQSVRATTVFYQGNYKESQVRIVSLNKSITGKVPLSTSALNEHTGPNPQPTPLHSNWTPHTL